MYKKLSANGYNMDKSANYLNNYQKYFHSMVNKEIKLLELGVSKGGSLLLWRDYFKKGIIVGLDSKPVQIDDSTGRIHIYQGFQEDTALLDQICEEITPDGFDVIIDDASHIGELTRISFWHLFDNHLKPGGLYVIEDWRVGYWEKWIDGRRYKPSSGKSFIKNGFRALIDLLLNRINNVSKHAQLQLLLKKALQKAKNLTYKRKFPSHNFGMVGFVKELVDELGMDMITNPARGSILPQRAPKFLKMEIFPGQVFIVKNPNENLKIDK